MTTVLGAGFGYIYVRTGSLVLPILLHAAVDISAMVTAWIVLRPRRLHRRSLNETPPRFSGPRDLARPATGHRPGAGSRWLLGATRRRADRWLTRIASRTPDRARRLGAADGSGRDHAGRSACSGTSDSPASSGRRFDRRMPSRCRRIDGVDPRLRRTPLQAETPDTSSPSIFSATAAARSNLGFKDFPSRPITLIRAEPECRHRSRLGGGAAPIRLRSRGRPMRK